MPSNRSAARQLFLAAALAVAAGGATAGEILPGPVPAQIVKIIDGDTMRVRARIWLGQELEVSVRLDGLDAPELRGKCEAERALAVQARDRLAQRAGSGRITLNGIRYGKYAGRVVARVIAEGGGDLAADLIAAGLAHPYAGGRRAPWCPEDAAAR